MDGGDHNRRIMCTIARSAFEVVNRLLRRDELLARDLRSQATRSRHLYREEHITVEMAATLRESFGQHVDIVLFTPPEEVRTGADWYWRFERGDRAIHASVQAKRIQRSRFGQPDDRGHIDIDLPQLRQLLEATDQASCRLPGLRAWLATYARFDALPPCGNRDLNCCNCHSHPDDCREHKPSVWIANAEEIAEEIAPLSVGSSVRRVSVGEIVKRSVRFDCVLPCIDTRAADYGPAGKGFELSGDIPRYAECVERIDGDPLLRSYYVGALRIAV